MANRFNSKIYLNAIYRIGRKAGERSCFWTDPNGYLFAEGRYRTKILPSDLPDWYVGGYLYKRQGFISAKGVVDIIYEPDYRIKNHWHKYDSLYVSYTHKMTRTVDKSGYTRCQDYDYVMDAGIAYDLLKKVKIYSPNFDTTEIERELYLKTCWFKMREEGDPLIITPETPIRVYSADMHEPWIVSLAFNDNSYWRLNMETLAAKLPKVAECKEYFSECRPVKVDAYCYGISFECGLHLTAEECYNFKEEHPKESW